MRKLFSFFLLSFLIISLTAQSGDPLSIPKASDAPLQIQAQRTTTPVKLDGILDEACWASASSAHKFWQYFPDDSIQAKSQTEVYMCYDDNFLYVAAKCFSDKDDYITPSLRRDFEARGNDNVTLVFDSFKDKTNAFVFGSNPFGVQREALIANGGSNPRRDWNTSWDNKWFSEANIHEGYWVAEFAIPFKTLRFKKGATHWNFNCYRYDTQSNENSTWTRIPREQTIISLAFMGEIAWEEPLQNTSANISVIPYLSGSAIQNHEEGETKPGLGYGIGGDAKIAVTPGLNLDLTVNPDFSQVEVDQQQTNLDRFELLFPERRQFFLENADLFSGFGFRRSTPFFSRRIGIGEDTAGNSIQNNILYGARLSGKVNKNWRVGFLNMQTARDTSNALESYNYTVAAVQRKVFNRSNIGFIFVNKQAFSDSTGYFSVSPDDYNRVLGVDYNLATANNRLFGKTYYHHSFGQDSMGKGFSDKAFSHGASFTYSRRNYKFQWTHMWIGRDFNPEVGFTPRTGFKRIRPEARWIIIPTKSKLFNRHGPGIEYGATWDDVYGFSDQSVELFWDFDFQNSGGARITLQNDYTFLFDSFDPTRTDATPLPAESDYSYSTLRLWYRSNPRKKFTYQSLVGFGQYFNGTRFQVSPRFSYRFQPYGSISVQVNYNKINLPDPYADADLLLIGPRLDLTFTRNLFFTAFFQYNNQIDNFNINARLQWRFKPVSDFFLVYTDNYDTTGLGIKNRAIIAKLTYWLNI